jgi:hypothetical protein
MPDTSDVTRLQEQIFDLMQKSQQAMVDAGRSFTDRVASLTPGDTDQLERLIDNAFDMTEKVLQTQRDFAKKVVEALTAQLPGIDRGGNE